MSTGKVDVTAAIEEQYQDATSFDDLVEHLDQHLVVADQLFAVRGELDDQLAALDLATPELTQAGYEADPIGIVNTTQELLDDAELLANTFDDLAETLASLGLAMPSLATSAFVDDRSVAQATLDSQLGAAKAVAAAHRARDAASFVARVGLIRSDVDRQLERADAELSAGKIDQAATTATHVVTERFEALTPDAWSGMSVSVFDDKLGIWRQTWVDDSANYWHFVGVDVEDGLCFGTPEPVDTEQKFKRMVFSDIKNAGFDWRWESSPDGRIWTRNWSIKYSRRA